MNKVSVIVPIYNTAEFIDACIECLINQTLQDIEIILVNDGSTDGSDKIAQAHAAKRDNMILISQENLGQSAARNRGIKVATGKYVYFMDSDDLLSESALEELWKLSEQNNLDFLDFSAKTLFDSSQLKEKYKNYDDTYIRKGYYPEVVSGKDLLVLLTKNKDYHVPVWSQFIRREYLVENGIQFYEGIIHEDDLFTFEAMVKAERAMCINQVYYYRRIRDNSTMTQEISAANVRGYFIGLQEHIQIAAEAGGTKEQCEGMLCVIRKLSDRLRRFYCNVGQTEREKFICTCSGSGKYLFEGVILPYIEEVGRLNSKISSLEKKAAGLGAEAALDTEPACYKLLFDKITRRVSNHAVVWLIKDRGIRYILYRVGLKFAPYKIRVSIIVPVYNAEKYLDECLRSLMGQSLKQIEMICVDDGSTDRSLEILQRYKKLDPRLTILEQEHKGAGAARNKGISHAKGEYLLFLDADDMFSPELCNMAYYQSHKNKAQLCLFGAERIDMQTMEKEKMECVLRENEIPDGNFSAADIKDRIFQVTTAHPWSKLYLRKFVLKNKLQFQNIQNANDVLFVRLACALAERITAVKGEPLVTYRYNSGSSLQSQKSRAPFEFYKAFRKLKKELKKRDLYDLVERSYVNMALKESLFNMRTAGSYEARRKVKELLGREGFDFFGLSKYGEEYFYNKEEYAMYLELENGEVSLYAK